MDTSYTYSTTEASNLPDSVSAQRYATNCFRCRGPGDPVDRVRAGHLSKADRLCLQHRLLIAQLDRVYNSLCLPCQQVSLASRAVLLLGPVRVMWP